MDVPVVARGPGLVGGRPVDAVVVDRPLAPEGVGLRLGVPGQDVGHDVGGLRADDRDGLRLRRRLVGPDHRSVGPGHLQDRRPRHPLAAVGDRSVRADHVDRVDLDRADRHRHDRHRLRDPVDTEVLGPVVEVVEAVHDPGLDRRDVEGELERRAEANGAALVMIRLGRDEPAAEVRRDVHEHRRGGHLLVVDADRVVERLDRRPGLPPAIRQDVELRLELLVARRPIRA